MNGRLLEWQGPPPSQSTQLQSMATVALEESRRHPVLLAGVFAGVALLSLAVGVLLPKKFTSSTTILVEESDIIAPLMEGRAVPTGVASRAAIARQVAFSRKVMDDILKTGGWLEEDLTPIEKDKLTEEITKRTRIGNPRENLIEITYTDSDAERAATVTNRFAELVITESLATKERESRAAYDFINSQVKQYHAKLIDAESKLEEYRKGNPDARPGTEADVNARLGELRRQVETARMELADLRSRETVLQAQLTGESEVTVLQTRTGQLLARLAELESERERLLVSYTEQHPDVVRVQHQIGDLQDELRREDDLRQSGAPTSLAGGATMNPLYGEIRSKLSETRSRIAALNSRISGTGALLAQELDRSRRIASSESSLAELTRDYEVNRDLYQDLLKRRENARVSMNLDAEHRGLSFRVQEPAVVPLRPSGLRLMHVAGAGLGAATLMPLLLLLGWVRFDPRVRNTLQIEQQAALPVLGSIPRYRTGSNRSRALRRFIVAGALVALVPLAYLGVLAVKLVNS